MFYATKIKSVLNGAAVDVNGKRLSFIGYLPVKPGDTVFTDGNVIFGNAPPKGSPAVFDNPSGIPVLADKSTDDKDLRGYSDLRGKFKKYKIAGDEWIVNDKRNFAHDVTLINDDAHDFSNLKIIDAELADNGDVFIASDGFFRLCDISSYHNHIFRVHHSTERGGAAAHTIMAYVEPHIGQLVTLGAKSSVSDVSADSDLDIPQKAPDIDQHVNIFLNGKLIDEFSLNSFASIAVNEAWRCCDDLMKLSADISSPTDLPQQPSPPANWIEQPAPPEPFIALAYSRIETFRFNQQGDWDAVISAAAYGFCFPFILWRGSVFGSIFGSDVDAPRYFCDSLVSALNSLESYIFTNHYFPFLQIEKYPSFTGEKKIDNVYTADYMQYIEDKLEYYIPIVRFFHYEWRPIIFGSYFLFHVHNGEIVNIMDAQAGGGNGFFDSGLDWDEMYRYSGYKIFGISSTVIKNDWLFPLGDDFFLAGNGSDINEVRYDKDSVFHIDSDMFSNISCVPRYPVYFDNYIDEVAIELAQQSSYDDELRFIWGRFITIFEYSRNRTYINKILKVDDKEIYYPIWIHLNEDTADGFFRLLPSCVKLRGGKFLFGLHDGNLFIVSKDGSFTIVGEGLKNFRLRELKNIGKAKR